MAAASGKAHPHPMDLSACELRDLVASGRVTPAAAVEACLERIAERDGAVGAFVFVDADGARRVAAEQTARLRRGEAVGPLQGVPIAVKDLEDVAGMPTWRGLVPLRERGGVAAADSAQVARLRAAGAVIVGKTNTPADGHIAITKNLLGPPSRNPWALDRSPGGSSGGSAAAVAARMVPWATASDGGGSIRIPASLTGTFGHKPTRGLIPIPMPRDGVAPWLRTAVMGPVTRTVADAALYLDVTHGYHPCDADSAVPTLGAGADKGGFAASVAPAALAAPRRLRVGFVASLVPGFEMQPDVRRCVDACADRLRRLAAATWGQDAVVELAVPPMPRFGREWTTAVGAYRIARFSRSGLTGPAAAAKIDRSITRDWPAIQRDFSIESMGECFAKIAQANHELARLFEACDVVVAPSLGLEAYGARGPAVYAGQKSWDPRRDPFVNMMPLNYSGHPSSVVRAGFSDTGLPCAVQLIAERGRDADALLLAALYERDLGCFDVWPEWPFRSAASSRL